MDEYKTIYLNASTPSLCFLLVSAGTAALCYGLKLGYRTDSIAGSILLVLWMLSIIPVYRASLKEPLENSNVKNLARLILLFLSSCMIAAGTCYSIFSITAGIDYTGDAPRTFIIEKMTVRRYDKGIILRSSDHSPAVMAACTAPLEADIAEGDVINIKASVRAVEGTDGFQRTLLRKGIGYRVYLDEDNWTTERRTGQGYCRGIRNLCEKQIGSLFSPSTAPLISALYFGNDDNLDRRTLINFKRAGVLHILAASGFNVGIVAFIPITILGLFRVNRKIIAVVCQAVLLGYFLISDMPVSLFRAVLMALLFALFIIADFRKNVVNILFFSAAIIIIMRPYELFNPGFQLSVGATLGILLFFSMFKEALKSLHAPVANSLALTFAAQLPVVPIIAVQMGEFNAAGIFSNLVMIPLTSGVIYSSLAANFLFLLFPAAAGAAAAVTDTLCVLSVTLVSFISSLDLHFTVSPLDPGLLCVIFLMTAPLVPGIKNKCCAAAAMLALSAALPVFIFSSAAQQSPAVFRTGKTIAVLMEHDGGMALVGKIGDFTLAREIVKEAVNSTGAGLSLYLPDPDYDTLQACAYIARNVPIRSCTISSNFRFSRALKRFFSILDRDGISIKIQPADARLPIFTKYDNFALDSQIEIMQLYYQGVDSAQPRIKSTIRIAK